MMTVLMILDAIISIALILAILGQEAKSGGMGGMGGKNLVEYRQNPWKRAKIVAAKGEV